MALKEINTVLEEQETCYVAMKDFFTKEPNEKAFDGSRLMLGNNFTDQVNDDAILNLVMNATNGVIQIALNVNSDIHNLADIPMLNGHYAELIQQTLSNSKSAESGKGRYGQ